MTFKSFSIIALLAFSQWAQSSPLQPLKLDNPRDTMKSFYSAMNDYRKGVKTGDAVLKERINDALRCMDLSKITPVLKSEQGRKAAILLKEVIDRVIVLDYSKIPEASDIDRWRLKDTEITVLKVQDSQSEQYGSYLISAGTVERAEEFYNKVKHLPYLPESGQGAAFKTPVWESMMPAWAKEKSLGLSNWQWLAIVGLLLFGFIIKTIAEFGVLILKKLTVEKENSLRHKTLLAVEHPIGLIFATGFWYVGVHIIKLEGIPLAACLIGIKITFSVSFIWASYNLTNVVSEYLQRFTEKTASTMDDQLVPLATKSLRVFVIVFGILLTIQSLGFNIMSIMAGLGLGGLAFALAAKDTAANLFGSIMILIDRPFKIGDWVKTSSVEGTVEEIGFRSTRVRTFYNSLVSVPNMEMATTAIDNMGLRKFRRENVTIGVTYDTSTEKLDAFMEGMKNIILAHPLTNKENFHVVFRGFGDFSLNIMLYYFVEAKDWAEELATKQHINLEIIRLAEDLKVEFAFPTQSIYVEGLPEGSKIGH